jgi:hypothetical protein
VTEITYDPDLFSERQESEKYHRKTKYISWHRRREIEEVARLKKALRVYMRAAVSENVWCPPAEASLEERFREEADKWERETAHLSSPLQRMMHPSYQAILGMGAGHKWDIVRLLLRDMQTKRRDWLLALSYLTQANPVSSKDAGKTDKLVSAWLRWGKEQGLL